jgi:hypothetical protein
MNRIEEGLIVFGIWHPREAESHNVEELLGGEGEEYASGQSSCFHVSVELFYILWTSGSRNSLFIMN